MELLNSTPDNSFSINIASEENELLHIPANNSTKNKAMSHHEEQEKYYKESILMNYQRYKALFRSKLISNILIDDKNMIRDLNKKAKQDFEGISGQELKIGSSLSNWFHMPIYGPILKATLANGLNKVVEFAYIDKEGVLCQFHLEIILFISPEDSRLLKCISAVRVR
jgi:hypothetical protein